MNVVYSVTEGWTKDLPFILKVNGVPFSLAGLTDVTLKLRRSSGTLVSISGTITVDPNQVTNPGKVIYTPGAGDFVYENLRYTIVQLYPYHWRVVDGSGEVAFFPNGEPDYIEVSRA